MTGKGRVWHLGLRVVREAFLEDVMTELSLKNK